MPVFMYAGNSTMFLPVLFPRVYTGHEVHGWNSSWCYASQPCPLSTRCCPVFDDHKNYWNSSEFEGRITTIGCFTDSWSKLANCPPYVLLIAVSCKLMNTSEFSLVVSLSLLDMYIIDLWLFLTNYQLFCHSKYINYWIHIIRKHKTK